MSTSKIYEANNQQQTANTNSKSQHYKQTYGQPELDITKEEFQRISDALKKEEFRKLFMDYIDEIQDPKNRKIYEDEIKQIEAERGVEVVFLNPEPGFVIKTSQDGNQKCFINCAKSAEIGKPSHEVYQDPASGVRGLRWSIPLAQAPPRDDLDNKRNRCRVYDVIFHPEALYMSERNKAFRNCLVDTALDAVEREFKIKLDRVNLKFPKMQFKGVARPTVIRKLAENAPAETAEPHPLENIYPARPTTESSKPKVLPMKDLSTTTTTNKTPEFHEPSYTIKHRRDIDMTEYTNELDAKLNVTIPRELVIDIDLPLLNSSSECQLDVTEKTVFLLSEKTGARYRLNLQLPYKVNDKEGCARFDAETRRLTVTLPVVQQTIEQKREMHEHLMHLCREDSGVESDIREDMSPHVSESSVEVLNNGLEEDKINLKEENDNAEQLANAETVACDDIFLKPDIDYQFPAKFDCNALNQTMCWVLQVRNVQPESLYIRQHSRDLHLRFTSIGSGYYPSHYAFYLQLPEDSANLQITNADAEAWENNVILNVHLNNSSESVTTYLAGLDGSAVKEYYVHEKLQVAHKSRQRKKFNNLNSSSSEPSDFDITVERLDGGKSIEIEIKTRNNEYNALSTTEDEYVTNQTNEDESEEQTISKKLHRKSKRKNKKRRSLSESACEDLKAYQQQQQQQQHQQNILLPPPVPEVNETEAVDGDEDSSPERSNEKSSKPKPIAIPSSNNKEGGLINDSTENSLLTNQQRKQRSFSESRDSVISCSAGSNSYKSILKRNSRYAAGRPSISDSCSSIDESSSNYSTSMDGMTNTLNNLRFSQSFSDIPEENVSNNLTLSESCKKTVRFSEVIKKQVFRMDSSILGQRKKNQKRRDRKLRALQRHLSESDSIDYEENRKLIEPLPTSSSPPSDDYDKNKNHINNNNNQRSMNKNNSSEPARLRTRLDSESSSDVDANKNSLMFDMDL